MARHPPPFRLTITWALQHPRARTNGPERLARPRRLDAIVDQCTVLAQYDDLVMAERVGLPGLEFGPLEHLVDAGRGDGGEDEIAGEDHDGIVGE